MTHADLDAALAANGIAAHEAFDDTLRARAAYRIAFSFMVSRAAWADPAIRAAYDLTIDASRDARFAFDIAMARREQIISAIIDRDNASKAKT